MRRGSERIQGRSAQAVDPLSWFNWPFTAPVLALLVLGLGTTAVLIHGGSAFTVVMQLVAVFMCTASCLMVHSVTRPQHPSIHLAFSVAIVLVSLGGYVLSAAFFNTANLSVDEWWAPGAVALAVANLAPYLSMHRLLAIGFSAAVAVTIVGMVLFSSGSAEWSVWGAASVVATPLVVIAVGAASFTFFVVRNTQRRLAEHAEGDPDNAVCVTFVGVSERVVLARLTARVTPFLEHIADSGMVTATERTVAAQLARRLRDDVASRADESWLDKLAEDHSIIVVDPARRAPAMDVAQRSALTGMIAAILEAPTSTPTSILVELRGEDGRETAVAISMDITLPEGRRAMHLAPYYLTLKTVFDGLSWKTANLLNMRFDAAEDDQFVALAEVGLLTSRSDPLNQAARLPE